MMRRVSDPADMPISRRVILSTMARRGMFNPGLPQRNVAQVLALRTWGYGLDGQLRGAAARSPGKIAVIDEAHGEISYAELLARSVKVAGALRAMGPGPGDAVGLLARNHVDAAADAESFGVHLRLYFAYLDGVTDLTLPDAIDHEHRRMSARQAWQDCLTSDADVLVCPTASTTAFAHDDRPFSERTITTSRGPMPYASLPFWISHASLTGSLAGGSP